MGRKIITIRTKYKKLMTKNTITCQIYKKIKGIKCHLEIDSDDSDGLCILHSQNLNKERDLFDAAFLEKIEKGDYDFRSIIFPYHYSFKERVFESEVNFSGAKFIHGATFFKAVFEDGVNFSDTKFYGKRSDDEIATGQYHIGVDFTYSIFKNIANFSLSEFDLNVDFLLTEFYCSAEFYGAKFRGLIHFSPTITTNYVNFNSSEFYGALYFRPNQFSDCNIYFTQARFIGQGLFESIYPFNEEFIGLKIEPQAKLTFNSISLAKAKFIGTNLRQIEFNNVIWHRYFGRDTLYDEIVLEKNSNSREYADVEELYRQLIINYKNKEDFKRVGDFHYGEMEMHRKASFWRRRIPISWYNLFWLLSGYGERPSRAIGWLIVFLLGMTSLVWGLGLEVANPPHIAGFGDSFIYLLQKVTLQRPIWAEPIGFWGKLVAGLSVLLIPGQAALFLLALRNRLGRRR
ncbi:MAG: hypothetical protein WCD80_14395 [Desulfobaccales bacterium]